MISIFVCALSVNADDSTMSASFSVGGAITGYAADRPIHIALYSSDENFKKQVYHSTLRYKAGELPPDTLRYEFSGIKAGYYMVAAFQDMNEDRKFNKGLFGRPLEPYCLYRRYAGLFAPSFSKCRFLLDRTISDADMAF